MPYIEQIRLEAYPNPEETGWQEKYVYAYAKDKVLGELLKVINSWDKEFNMLADKLKKEETDAILA